MFGTMVFALIIIGGLGWLLWYVLHEATARRARIDDDLLDERTPTLEYVLPPGHEASPVLAALGQAGYTTTIGSGGPAQTVVVKCPRGVEAEREKVRSVIASAEIVSTEFDVPVPDDERDVRFSDER